MSCVLIQISVIFNPKLPQWQISNYHFFLKNLFVQNIWGPKSFFKNEILNIVCLFDWLTTFRVKVWTSIDDTCVVAEINVNVNLDNVNQTCS